MKSFLHFSTIKPENPDVVFIKLHPENAREKLLLDENKDNEAIKLYYLRAIQQELPEYNVLGIVNMSMWPHAAEISVQKA